MPQQLRNFTPEDLLAILGLPTIGGIGLSEIRTDIQTNGRHSKMAVAVSSFNAWAASVGITVADLTTTEFSFLELALKYYTLYLYKDLDIMLKAKSECTEDDYRLLARLQTEAAKAMKNIGANSTSFINQMTAAINADTSVGPFPADITELVKGTVVTDHKGSALVDGTSRYFGDNKITVEND